jgi:hypothetical protein
MLITKSGGERQVFVYGQDGVVKSLPENMLDKVITASADEIANSAGIFDVKQQAPAPTFSQTNQLKTTASINRTPVYQTPVQNQSVPNTVEDIQTEDKTRSVTEKKETSSLNPKPE